LEEERLRPKRGEQGHEKVAPDHTVEKAGVEILNYLRKIAKLTPAVSVIVPNYNHEPYLEERLETIYKQDFKDIEVILLDDASTDQSVEVLAKYTDLYPAITILLCNKENSGSVFQQWKKGAAKAQAKLLWIAESDDVSDERFLRLMLPQMSDSEVMLGYCQSYAMGGKRHEAKTYADMGYYDLLGRERWYHSYTCTGVDEITGYLAVYNIIPNVSSTLIRNTGLNEVLDSCSQYKLSGDWAFYLSHIEGGKISYLAQPLNYHRTHPDSVIASNRNEILFSEFEQVHYWVAKCYHLSSSIKEMMLRCVVDIVYAHYGKGLGKTLEDLYAIQKIQMASPDVNFEQRAKKTSNKSPGR
jgi:glycosyltransferase involved in cell wall biosynthesis